MPGGEVKQGGSFEDWSFLKCGLTFNFATSWKGVEFDRKIVKLTYWSC